MPPAAYCLKCLMTPKTTLRSRSGGVLTIVCFQSAVASKGGDLLLVPLWLQGPYPGSHRVGICLYGTGVVPIEARGYSTPPICLGNPACYWDCVLSMHAAGHPEESTTLPRLMVVASYRLLLVLEEVGLMTPFRGTSVIGMS